MPNAFITPSAVVRDAALVLNDSLIIGNLVNRKVEQTFATKIGSSVKVKSVPNLGEAQEFTGSTSATAVIETGVDIVLEKHFYKKISLTSDESTLQVDDFTTTVVIPSVQSLVKSIEGYFAQKIIGGFARNTVGTSGTSPSTHAHILAAEKEIFNNRGNSNQLVGLITSTTHASLAGLNVFTSQDFGSERPAGLRSNSLGMMSGVNFFRSPDLAYTQGAVAGTPAVDGTVALGLSTIHLDGFTSEDGVINEGTRFTIAGHTSVYTILADVTLVNYEGDFLITPVLEAEATDEDLITFQTSPSANVIYNPMGVSAAIIPGAVIDSQTSIANINGLGIRIMSDASTDTLDGTWVFDCYAGCKVVMNEMGAVMQG